jgi:hypothetical protein
LEESNSAGVIHFQAADTVVVGVGGSSLHARVPEPNHPLATTTAGRHPLDAIKPMSSPTLSQTSQTSLVHRDVLGTCSPQRLAPGSFKIHIVRMISLFAGGTGIGFVMALNRGS